MEFLLIYLTYLFWKAYRISGDKSNFVLFVAFLAISIIHVITSLIMAGFLGYKFPHPWNPHHLYFMALLVIMVYVIKFGAGRVNSKAHVKKNISNKDEAV